MTGLIISVITILLVIFIIIALDAFLHSHFSYIIADAKQDDGIEAQLRILLKENPSSDIIVIDKTQTEETKEILAKLSQDFPQLYIVKADR